MNVLKKNKDAPEKIFCGLNPGHVNFVENVFATIADLNVPVLVALKSEFDKFWAEDYFIIFVLK